MPLAEYLLGLAILLLTWGGALGAALIVVRRTLPRSTGAPRALAFAVIGTAAIVGAELVPAALGVLSRWTALAAALAALAVAWRFVPRLPGAPRDDRPADAPASGTISWGIAAVAVAAAAAWTLAKVWAATREASTDVDTVMFHLPVVGRWLETGSIWQVDQYSPLLANGNYPHNGDLIFASVVSAFESDAFVRAVNLPWVVMAGLSVYAIARELAAPRATAVLCGALFTALPVVTLAAYEGAKTDPIMWGCFGAGTLFLIRHLRRRETPDLVLAGVGLGLAFGTKWYGVSAAVVVVAVWAAVALVRRRGVRVVARDGAALAGLIAAAGGIWLVRNAIESGSPVFPVSLPPLWETPRDFIRECAGYRIADYATDGAIWADYIIPAYREKFGLPGLFMLIGWVAAAPLAVRRRSMGAATVLLAVAALALAYSVTPYTALGLEGQPLQVAANTRWIVPALVLAAALLAWAAGALGRLRPVAEAVLLVATVVGLERGADLPARTVAAAALGLVLCGAAVYGVLLLRQRLGREALVPAVAAGAAVVALAALGYARQRDYHADRYARGGDPVIEYLAQRTTPGSRVAIVGVAPLSGTAPVWPAFGPRLSNHVEFVGPTVDGQLREYTDRRSWTRAVERGDFDLLVVGRGAYAAGCPVPGRGTDDDAWARASGYEPIASTPRLTLYRVR